MPKVRVGGVAINYRIVGDGSYTVLCLPGYLAKSITQNLTLGIANCNGTIDLNFGPFFEKADKSKFKFVSWDPPGYGESIPPKREFVPGYLQRDADIVSQLMEALNIDKYSVLGWSQGGATGIHLAADNPGSVRKLITIGTEAELGPTSISVYKAMKNIDFWPPESLKKQLKCHKRNYLIAITAEMSELCNHISRNRGGDYLLKAPSLVKCPTLIVHGQEDTTSIVEHAHMLRDKIKKSELLILPTAKHDIHLSHMDEFMGIFEKFLLSGP